METSGRIAWIDMARGICMIAILLFHTEMYYAGREVIPYSCYVENALLTFVFISGYLFYKPQKYFSFSYKLSSIARTLILPYFLFTILLALPKALAHGNALSFSETLLPILTGKASWFIAALIVAELLFSFFIIVSRGKNKMLSTLCALPFFLTTLLYHLFPSETLTHVNIWCWQNAFIFLWFMYLGYYIHQHPRALQLFNTPYFIILLLIIVILIKYIEYTWGYTLTVEPINISSFTVFLIDGMLTSALVILISQRIPSNRMMIWTGQRSLIYYFFCGGGPLIISTALNRWGMAYDGHYHMVILAFVLVYILTSLIAWILYPLLQRLTGKHQR